MKQNRLVRSEAQMLNAMANRRVGNYDDHQRVRRGALTVTREEAVRFRPDDGVVETVRRPPLRH